MVTVAGLDTVEQALGDLKRKTPAAAKVAINATARQARKLMVAKAKTRYAVNAAGRRHLKDLVQRKKASNSSLMAELHIAKMRNDLGYFKTSPAVPTHFTGIDFKDGPSVWKAKVLKSNGMKWSLYLYLNPIYDRLFIEDSYACRKGKGSHKAAKRLQYWMCQVQRKPGPGWYCLKLDISKYFYRVNHEKLLAILGRRVKDPAMMAFIRGVVNSRAEPFGLPRWRTPQDTLPEEWLYEVNKRLPRTKVYFCHPYSSWERGTNENTNGMIRRRFPKGTNFAAVTNAQITQAENWINNYPRKILGYKSSEIVFRECLRELGIAA